MASPFRVGRLAAEVAAALMFAAVFLIFCLKIAMRYAGGAEMAWSDEVCVILFVWIIFWTDSFLLAERDHIRFDLVTHAVPPGVGRAMAAARAVLVGGLFLYAAPATLDYVHFLWRERTPVLGLRLDWVYACFAGFVLTVPLRAAISLWRLARPGWRDAL